MVILSGYCVDGQHRSEINIKRWQQAIQYRLSDCPLVERWYIEYIRAVIVMQKRIAGRLVDVIPYLVNHYVSVSAVLYSVVE